MNLSPAEREQYDERVAIVLEGGDVTEAKAREIALEGIKAARAAKRSA